jgi:hypothetical protein
MKWYSIHLALRKCFANVFLVLTSDYAALLIEEFGCNPIVDDEAAFDLHPPLVFDVSFSPIHLQHDLRKFLIISVLSGSFSEIKAVEEGMFGMRYSP